MSLRFSAFGFILALAPIPAPVAQTAPVPASGEASPLLSRVGNTPESILKLFDEPGTSRPTAHVLTAEERRQLSNALDALPPLHRQVLGERLRTLSFLDGMPNTALTSPGDPKAEHRQYDITIRSSIFRQTASEFLTEKERTCFSSKGSEPGVSIEAGETPAILYVLLHEGTHVVDGVLHFTPSGESPDPNANPFTRGVWTDRTTPAPLYRDALLESVRFRHGGRVLPIEEAPQVYLALGRTPFASLYGSSNWGDDLAEYVALYHLTHELGQPFRIVIREGGREPYVYEPMKSRRVLERADRIKRFYETRAQVLTRPGKTIEPPRRTVSSRSLAASVGRSTSCAVATPVFSITGRSVSTTCAICS